MKIFQPNPDRLEHYHWRRRWAKRLSWTLYGLFLTAFLGAAAAGGYIYYHFLQRPAGFHLD